MSRTPLAHEAPASAGGILYQLHRMLRLLAVEASAIRIGFEVLDDAAVQLKSGLYVEQDKFSSVGDPLTNESESIWKTISNWMDICKNISPELRAGTMLCIVTNSNAPAASPLVLLLARARKSVEDVSECLVMMTSIYNDRQARAQARSMGAPKQSVPKKDYVSIVMNGDQDALAWVVECMSIVFGAEPVSTNEREEIARHLHVAQEEKLDLILNAIAGWLSVFILKKISARIDCWVDLKDFNSALSEIRQSIGSSPQQIRSLSAIPPSEMLNLGSLKIFRDKLNEVGFSTAVLRLATQHFLGHQAEMLDLTSRGAIIDTPEGSHKTDFYSELHDRWNYVYTDFLDRGLEGDLKEIGRAVFRATADRASALPISLGRIEVHQTYFLQGGLHALANDSIASYELWWMPRPTIEDVEGSD